GEDVPASVDKPQPAPPPGILDSIKLRLTRAASTTQKDKDTPEAVEPPPHSAATSGADGKHLTDPKLGDAQPIYYTNIKMSSASALRLDYIRSSGNNPPPPEYRAFRKQVDDVARLVRVVFQDEKDQQQELFDQLHATAWSGLCGANSNLDVGAD